MKRYSPPKSGVYGWPFLRVSSPSWRSVLGQTRFPIKHWSPIGHTMSSHGCRRPRRTRNSVSSGGYSLGGTSMLGAAKSAVTTVDVMPGLHDVADLKLGLTPQAQEAFLRALVRVMLLVWSTGSTASPLPVLISSRKKNRFSSTMCNKGRPPLSSLSPSLARG